MSKRREVYLDNAATTPINKDVLGAMEPYLTVNYGNPGSLHRPGRVAREAVEKARTDISKVLNCKSEEIIFTSGGTESDNLAILGLARANRDKGKNIIVSNIEHKAVLDTCKKLEKEGFTITYLKADKNGFISVSDLKEKIKSDTILVSVMYANNEVGTIQPIREIAKVIKKIRQARNFSPIRKTQDEKLEGFPIFHVDACQAAPTLTLDIKKLGVDALTISSSKIYGPKGIGCLYVNSGHKIEPIIFGGGQEKNLRSGTENVASIVGFSKALVLVQKNKLADGVRLTKLRNYLYLNLKKEISGVKINGSLKKRLPNNLNISISDVEGETLVLLLDDLGIYCGTGSACSSLDLKPSYVLTNIGVPVELAHCSVRFTLGRQTTKSDIDYVIKSVIKMVNKVRSYSVIKHD
jgi:cysteine desulfurase